MIKQQFELTSRKNCREKENGLQKSLHFACLSISCSTLSVQTSANQRPEEHDLKTGVYIMSFNQ